MKELFNKNQIEQELKTYHLDINIINKAKEVFTRWNTSVDLTKEKPNQIPFLTEFFGEILGYQSIAGKRDNSLWWEEGSIVDGKKPDGILGFNLADFDNKNDIRVVIELKDSTVKLDERQKRKDYNGTPVEQGFRYASKVGGKCEWIIISNFAEIRLYKFGDESKYHSFKLSELANDDNKIKEFHFLLAKDGLFTEQYLKSNIHNIILDREENKEKIQEEFYNLYKTNRTLLKEHLITTNHLQERKGFCLYASDKLLRRIIFIVFCQERGLIPYDTLENDVKKQRHGSKYKHLKDVFHSINIGNNKINPQIPAFNGGLFKEDKFIDELHIEDDKIDDLLFVLDYAFRSELDVEILGHIFEKSISDLQNEAEEDKNDTVKEKDEQEKFGVYYTPSYVTKYIVSEAIGKWLNDKKIQITQTYEEESDEFLEEYKKALSSIKVLDPACGSGAFLVEVLDFLLHEWKKLGVDNNYKFILQNNIYGVDINPNSAEITKLSLWLKTAYNKEKLLSLDGNIKIGNSLLEDENIAGRYDEYEGKVVYDNTTIADGMFSDIEKEKQAKLFSKSLAFDWQKEFGFKFDVIVGNPPYIKEDKHREIFEPLNPANKKYKSTKKSPAQNKPPFASQYYQGKMDFWQFFACLGLDLLNDDGYLSYIAPSSWITNHGASKTRNKIIQASELIRYIDFSDNKVFKAADIQTMIFFLHKTPTENHEVEYCKIANAEGKLFTHKQVTIATSLNKNAFETIELETASLIDNTIHFVKSDTIPLIDKIEKIGTFSIKDKKDIYNGIDYPQDRVNKKSQKTLGKSFKIGNGIFSITTAEKDAMNLTTKELEIVKPEYTTEQIDRYFADNKNTRWTIYTDSSFKKPDKIKEYPNIKKHLDKFEKVITSDNAPYGLNRARTDKSFTGQKILVIRKSTQRPRFSYVDFDCYFDRTFLCIKPSDINLKYLTGLLNSRLIAFYLKNKGKMQGSNYQIDIEPLCKIPLVIASNDIQAEIIKKVELMIETNNTINAINQQFFKLLAGDFSKININKQLGKWSELSWNEFLSEIAKQKFELTSKQEEKWLERFEEKQAEIKQLQSTLTRTDAEIDKMVYALYGLSEEEIKVVEGLAV